jgi:hypothetical protein
MEFITPRNEDYSNSEHNFQYCRVRKMCTTIYFLLRSCYAFLPQCINGEPTTKKYAKHKNEITISSKRNVP